MLPFRSACRSSAVPSMTGVLRTASAYVASYDKSGYVARVRAFLAEP